MAFKQLRLSLKTPTYPFLMALKFFPILLNIYETFKKNSQEFKSKTLYAMIF